ncbi:Glutamine-dependent NAD(+) synthetase [Pontiella desulfatans]|uniref:Glutamine-dependent NAD(+) synthetase n=1 Tax=Pontiella desulfatans TaxID=2750659 RepID=A0A6C2U5S8_PONDE|nr:NAD+ synthase [Pontiella desulfatans]VGO15243.1 Glutamine-dependent NAD(+) synthetase [Pontiella desulfatans]
MKTALIQMNPTVGALQSNADLVVSKAHEAFNEGARLIVFPELAISGYPPEDLILKDHFCGDCEAQLERLKTELPPEATVVVGAPVSRNGKKYNAALVFNGSGIIGEYHKMLLPNYGVFDEKRLFEAGTGPLVIDLDGQKAGIHICEDSWEPGGAAVASLEDQGIDLLINLSASPYHRGKLLNNRINVLAQTAQRLNTPLLYCNMVGGQDELVFDGASMVFAPDGSRIARAKQFQEDILYFSEGQTEKPARKELPLPDLEEVYEALKLGLRDYVNKIGFKRVVVALSGGIDSALVLAIAVDALGKDRVASVTMPSQYSSSGTLGDAHEMAKILDIEFHEIPIKGLYDNFEAELSKVWGADKQPGLAEENLQARIRGNLIMALSNEYGWLVLTTGNKSEMAMGYCTIYGDMAGGFAVIKDVPKTLVFELCRWRNEQGIVMPPSIIERPPSAELRPDQKDSDSLPPYEVLDPILEDYVENDMGIDGLVAKGYDEALVRRVVHAVELSEYKRRQSPPGVKITPKSFDRDRRIPIVNRYRN